MKVLTDGSFQHVRPDNLEDKDGGNNAGPAKLQSFLDEQPETVWSVAAGKDGTLYAGTGPDGRLWSIDKGGKAKVVFSSTDKRVTAVTVTAAVALLPAYVAVTVAAPAATPVTTPDALTVMASPRSRGRAARRR